MMKHLIIALNHHIYFVKFLHFSEIFMLNFIDFIRIYLIKICQSIEEFIYRCLYLYDANHLIFSHPVGLSVIIMIFKNLQVF